MAEESVANLLNNVWGEFRRAGITDDLRVIESVACSLLRQENISDPPSMTGIPLAQMDQELPDIREYLAAASAKAGGAATLFDRYVLFRLPKLLLGGRYPTPRHIVRFMMALADGGGSDMADFACGSGGFLVHAPNIKVTGVEISPEWAFFAETNCLLHGLDEYEIKGGNALRLAAELSDFDTILMNPPFGEKVKSEHGSRSETAFSAMAVQHLRPGGCAALLSPSGLLYNASQHEAAFRRQLLLDHRLEAVITLPKDAFQPYSPVETHLLLVKKKMPDNDSVTWFIRPAFDGYVSGRGRDLTEEPKSPNDLDFIVNAFPLLGLAAAEDAGAVGTMQWIEDDVSSGAILRPTAGAVLAAIRYIPQKKKNPAVLLVDIEQQGQRERRQYSVDGTKAYETVAVDDDFLRKRAGLPADAPLPRPLFQNRSTSRTETLTAANVVVSGVLLKLDPAGNVALAGVAISRAILHYFDFSLDPDLYLHEPEIHAEQRLPHDIIRDIRDRERVLAAKMSQLAGWLLPEGSGGPLPSPIDDAMPFGPLDMQQQLVWEAVVAMREEIEGNAYAVPFTARDILASQKIQENAVGGDAVLMAFEVLEAMGLILRVTLRHPETGVPSAFYRRLEKRDTWRRKMESNG